MITPDLLREGFDSLLNKIKLLIELHHFGRIYIHCNTTQQWHSSFTLFLI